MLRGKRTVVYRMSVLCRDNEVALSSELLRKRIGGSNHRITLRNRQGSARAEVILYVDQYERFLWHGYLASIECVSLCVPAVTPLASTLSRTFLLSHP
jgi:hypothetical protein